jgi:hypothetical protein
VAVEEVELGEQVGGGGVSVVYRACWRRPGGPAVECAAKLTQGRVSVGINPIITLEKKATEYDRKPVIKWLSCTAK